jgi:hypothetical protein
MAIEPAPDTLLRLHTQTNIIKARTADLQVKVYQRRVVAVSTLARYAALVGAGSGIEPVAVAVGLEAFMRAVLWEIATGPGRQSLAAEIAQQGRQPGSAW